MNTRRLVRLLLAVFVLVVPLAASAQTDSTLELYVRRNVGYSGAGEIQGSFRLETNAPPGVVSVTFYIDDTVVGTDAEAPFRVDFDTDNYAVGPHTLRAEGALADGGTLSAAPRQFSFVSAADSWRAAQDIFVPIFSVALVLIVLFGGLAVFQAMRSKANPTPLGALRKYGLLGGAICPKCGRPFSRHWWGLNAGLGKFDRCDHCGKWSLVRALPLAQLRAAEAAELKNAGEGAGAVPEPSKEERLRKQLDDSRYSDN
ncbi:MAG: hypothetical protein IT317_20170 [Anaerolineales bacterium]|nr:hypothetical protein [Anaerolineales bacterium]